MRKTIALLAIVLVCFACKQNKTLDGAKVVLIGFNQVEIIPIDTAVIKNMKFSFDGKKIKEGVYYILSDDSIMVNEAIDITNGMPVYIDKKGLKGEIIDKEVKIMGNVQNEAFTELTYQLKAHYAEMNDIYDNAEEDKINEELATVVNKIKNSYSSYFTQQINTPLGGEAFFYYLNMGAFEGIFTDIELEEIVDKANESFHSNPMVAELKAMWAEDRGIGVGAKFTDFETKDINGKTVHLSDIADRGDYVLIDFWASWCKPCLQEMDVLKEVYKDFGDKNFKIVSISLDADKDAWKNKLKELKLPWIQWGHGEDVHEAASIYKVRYIPHTILLDPNGIIIEKEVRGDEIAELLDAFLNQ